MDSSACRLVSTLNVMDECDVPLHEFPTSLNVTRHVIPGIQRLLEMRQESGTQFIGKQLNQRLDIP